MSLRCTLTGHHMIFRDQPRSALTSLFYSLSQATSEEEKTVLVTIRGTAQVEDVVTDLCCAPDVRRCPLMLFFLFVNFKYHYAVVVANTTTA